MPCVILDNLLSLSTARALDIKLKKLILVTIASLTLVACSSETPPAADETAFADTGLTGNTGQVLSVVQVQGYTYIEVRNNGRSLWLAGNPVEVDEGEIISWADSAMMRKFQSKALNRTFDELMFVSAIYKGADSAPQPTANKNSGVVRSNQDAAGYTYIELENDAGQVVWLAEPQTGVAVGNRVSWGDGSVMTNFTSDSLNMTFPEILFVQSISVSE